MNKNELTKIIIKAGLNYFGEEWQKHINKEELLALYHFLFDYDATDYQAAKVANWYFEGLANG